MYPHQVSPAHTGVFSRFPFTMQDIKRTTSAEPRAAVCRAGKNQQKLPVTPWEVAAPARTAPACTAAFNGSSATPRSAVQIFRAKTPSSAEDVMLSLYLCHANMLWGQAIPPGLENELQPLDQQCQHGSRQPPLSHSRCPLLLTAELTADPPPGSNLDSMQCHLHSPGKSQKCPQNCFV